MACASLRPAAAASAGRRATVVEAALERGGRQAEGEELAEQWRRDADLEAEVLSLARIQDGLADWDEFDGRPREVAADEVDLEMAALLLELAGPARGPEDAPAVPRHRGSEQLAGEATLELLHELSATAPPGGGAALLGGGGSAFPEGERWRADMFEMRKRLGAAIASDLQELEAPS